ncbi:unnamed protein product, partial [marine sediment metagenome]
MTFPAAYDDGASDRGRSTKLWHGFNTQAMKDDRRRGWFRQVDFTESSNVDTGTLASGGIVDTQSTAGTLVVATGTAGEGPILQIDSGATTADQGMNIQWGIPIQMVAGYDTVFEFCVK